MAEKLRGYMDVARAHPVVYAVCFFNNLSGDVHAHVTRGRSSGDVTNCP